MCIDCLNESSVYLAQGSRRKFCFLKEFNSHLSRDHSDLICVSDSEKLPEIASLFWTEMKVERLCIESEPQKLGIEGSRRFTDDPATRNPRPWRRLCHKVVRSVQKRSDVIYFKSLEPFLKVTIALLLV